MRLSTASLDRLVQDVGCFSYDRARQAVGIVHFGIGAFHRAHQAWYTDLAMDAGEPGWAIAGVSPRSSEAADRLNPQDSLFSVTERSLAGEKTRVIGAVAHVLVASQTRDAMLVLARMGAPATRLASFTITEKGYCRAADGSLDFDRAGEGSVYRFIADGLRRRRDAGRGGLTLLCCDNLSGNGEQFARLVDEYCDRVDPALGKWIAAECSFPSTMVDRIVPATAPGDLEAVERVLGLRDEAAVVTEPFSQWVIEDRFVAGRPAWEKVGAELVANVTPYETAKLRMLNGAHSALAYLGLARGYRFVHEAVADIEIRPLVERLIRHEAAESFSPAPCQNLEIYSDALLARFANPALNHRLVQIAMDGSQKIPQRWLETLAYHQHRGRDCPSILTALGAWLRHVRGDNGFVDDPMSDRLGAAWRRAGETGIVEAIFGPNGIIVSPWRPTQRDRAFLLRAMRGTGRARQRA